MEAVEEFTGDGCIKLRGQAAKPRDHGCVWQRSISEMAQHK
jgi:hypothetical protein